MLPLLLGAALIASPTRLADFRHVTFKGTEPTRYAEEGEGFKATVDASASFLLLPYPEPRAVRSVRFRWRGTGELKVRDAEHEETKGGDDARLRIGLLLAGKAPLVPFFAPAWIKLVRDLMKQPSDKILYLVVDSRHAAGARWSSPFGGGIESVALASTSSDAGWREARFDSPKPLDVVGLWIMADGDGTASRFETTATWPELSP